MIAAVSALHFSGQSGVQAAGLEPDVASEAEQAERLGLPPAVERGANPTLPDESPAAAFLTAYFGPDAPAVRTMLTENGTDLDSMPPPVSPEAFRAMLPQWLVFNDSERESWRHELEAWPTKLTSDWLQQRLSVIVELNDDDLEALDALASLYRPDIQAATDRYLDSLEVAMSDELQWGGIKTSPFLAWPPPAPGGPPSFFSMVRAGQGWVAQISLDKTDHPDAYAARTAIALEIEKRDSDLKQTLLALQ